MEAVGWSWVWPGLLIDTHIKSSLGGFYHLVDVIRRQRPGDDVTLQAYL
jgi:hypothetical protein